MFTREKGLRAEAKAIDYLTTQGLKLITQNYHCKWGEIDLIMRDQDYLVFVEVRSRVSQTFGGGLGSITYAKQQKIIKSATHYLMVSKQYHQFAMRFDVVSLDGASAAITWIKDAFGMNY